MRIRYQGGGPTVLVGVAAMNPGDVVTVDNELGVRLLKRDDFVQVRPPKGDKEDIAVPNDH